MRVDRDAKTLLQAAYGDADHACGVPISVWTRFGVGGVTKGLTALVAPAH